MMTLIKVGGLALALAAGGSVAGSGVAAATHPVLGGMIEQMSFGAQTMARSRAKADARAEATIKRLGLRNGGAFVRPRLRPGHRVVIDTFFGASSSLDFEVSCYDAATGAPMPVMVWATVNGRSVDLTNGHFVRSPARVRAGGQFGLRRVKVGCGGHHSKRDAIVVVRKP